MDIINVTFNHNVQIKCKQIRDCFCVIQHTLKVLAENVTHVGHTPKDCKILLPWQRIAQRKRTPLCNHVSVLFVMFPWFLRIIVRISYFVLTHYSQNDFKTFLNTWKGTDILRMKFLLMFDDVKLFSVGSLLDFPIVIFLMYIYSCIQW